MNNTKEMVRGKNVCTSHNQKYKKHRAVKKDRIRRRGAGAARVRRYLRPGRQAGGARGAWGAAAGPGGWSAAAAPEASPRASPAAVGAPTPD